MVTPLCKRYQTGEWAIVSEIENKIYARLTELENEVVTLRDGYLVVNKRYSRALMSMKVLTSSTLEAAIRAAAAAEKSSLCCQNAALAAKAAAAVPVIEAAEAAAAATMRATTAAAAAAKLALEAAAIAKSLRK